MTARTITTTQTSQWVYGYGQYLTGLGVGFGIARSAWWLLLIVVGLALCAYSGWLNADAEIKAADEARREWWQ